MNIKNSDFELPPLDESKVAMISGVTGQDGSYLAELLLKKGYCVHGLVRRTSTIARTRIDGLFHDKTIYNQRFFLHYAELDDTTTIRRIIHRTQPTEFYHLAGQSHVGTSFEVPETTCQFTGMGTLKLLEIFRDLEPQPKFLHISSSEIFGRPSETPQNEDTAMRPVTPYGVAKTFATQMVRLYRESFGLFACNAICYNHESPRRGESFVTRKISRSVAAIAEGRKEKLKLGVLTARRDWGYAPEYVEAMWKMLQMDVANDYVLATGVHHSVEDFLSACFESAALNWRDHVEQDARLIRPAEVANLVGDPLLAENELGWKAKTDLRSLAKIMVDHDRQLYRESKSCGQAE